MRNKVLRVLLGTLWLTMAAPALHAAGTGAAAAPPAGKGIQQGVGDSVVAKIGDWQLSLGEVDKLLASQLYDAQTQVFRLRMQVIQDRLAEQLLTLEAKETKTTPDDLMRREVEAKVPKITDEELKKFIEENKSRFPNNGEGMDDKVRGFLQERATEKIRDDYLITLIKKFKAEVHLLAPSAPRFKVPAAAADEASKGKANAPVVIYEFADFQCPFCSKVPGVIKELEKAYPDQIRFVYRHYTLPSHAQAPKAAEASQCAGEQGKFWEFYDHLYANQAHLEVADLKKVAVTLKLDTKKFDGCLDSSKFAKRVAEDRETGDQLGISGTPTFFINGLKMVGALPIEQLKQVIDAELMLIKQKQAQGGAPSGGAAAPAKKK